MFSGNTKNTETKKEMSNTEASSVAIMIGGASGIFLINKNMHKIENWHFNHFEEIYLVCFGLAIMLTIFLIFMLKKKTADMDKRAFLLSPLWGKGVANIEIGKTKDGIDIHLNDESRSAHVQVIGTTGSGKTKSVVIPWSIRDLKRGKSVVIIDGKGASDLPEEIFNIIETSEIACKQLHFDLDNPDQSVSINPLRHGTAQQITDRIFSSFEFQDPFYSAVQYDICGYLIKLIIDTKRVVTFKQLYILLTDDKELSKLISELDVNRVFRDKLKNYLRESVKDRRNKMAGLISQISPFANSEIAEIVNCVDDNSSLSSLMLNSYDPQIFIFSIPTLKYQKLGHQLGKLILQELAWCIGERERLRDNNFTSVILDEFPEFIYEGFISILNKARSAKVAMHLCHQALSDFTAISESFARSINTNTNVKCILGLNDPETADFYARHLGTLTTEKYTEQTVEGGFFRNKEETGRASMREVESYKIHPNILKGLYQGKGVIHLPTKRGVVTEEIMFKAFNHLEENFG